MDRPVLVEQGWTTVANGQDKFHPVGNADPDSHWVANARRSGTEAYAEAEYLKQFLRRRSGPWTTTVGRTTSADCGGRRPG